MCFVVAVIRLHSSSILLQGLGNILAVSVLRRSLDGHRRRHRVDVRLSGRPHGHRYRIDVRDPW